MPHSGKQHHKKPGTTRSSSDDQATALQLVRRPLGAAPTQATLPHCSISITRQTSPSTGHHPGRYSESRVIPDLHSTVHVASGITHGLDAVCPHLPVRHSFRRNRDCTIPTISRGRTQKLLLYPSAASFRSSAASPVEFTRKGFRPFCG